MIDFNHIQLLDEPHTFVMPQAESGYLLFCMRKAGIDYEAWGFRDILRGKAPLDIKLAASAMAPYGDVGLETAPPCIIESRVRPEDLLLRTHSLYAEPFDQAFAERQRTLAWASERDLLTATPGIWYSVDAMTDTPYDREFATKPQLVKADNGMDVVHSQPQDILKAGEGAGCDFTSTTAGEFCVREAIALYRPSIEAWVDASYYGDCIGLSVLFDPKMYAHCNSATRSGRVVSAWNGLQRTYYTDAVYVVLVRDPGLHCGFMMYAAYPDFRIPELVAAKQAHPIGREAVPREVLAETIPW